MKNVESGRRRRPMVWALGALLLVASPVGAATITVTTGADGAPADDGQCTLREAVLLAREFPVNDDCGSPSGAADEIVFGGGVTQVDPTEGEMQITTAITITGPVIIDGASNGNARVFGSFIDGSSDLTLSGITFQNFDASTSGGGVINATAGNLTIDNCNFNNNKTQGDGGAIYFTGDTLAINGIVGPTTFADNQAQTDGGALYVHADVAFTVTGPVNFNNNQAGDDGGAIALNTGSIAPVTIVAANFSLNKANGDGANGTYGGGAIHNIGGDGDQALILIQGSSFVLNEAPSGNGGAIFNQGVISWPDVINGLGDLHLGGVFECFFFQNKAGGSDGPDDGLGGAIYNAGRLAVLGSTFAENESTSAAGGGLANVATYDTENDRVKIVNSTFSANVAATQGGNLSNAASNAKLRLVQVTLSGGDAPSGGNLYNANTGANSLEIRNSIVANPASGGNCGGEALVDQGGNLQFPGATCGASILTGDPLLQALLPNPPPIQPTMALGGGSAALGLGLAATCSAVPVLSVDQRLFPRPQGGGSCDAGAYESSDATPEPGYGSVPAAPGPLGIVTFVNVAANADLAVSETGSATLDVSNVQVTGDPEITLVTASSFSIPDGGPSVTVTVSCVSPNPGSYSATLQLTHNGTAPGSPASPTSYTVDCTVNTPEPGYGSVPAPPGPLNIVTSQGAPGNANLTVSETGTAALTVSSVQLVGDPEITLVTPGGFSIPDGGPSATVTVGCLSATAGAYTATLTLTHDGTFGGSPPSPTSYGVSCTVNAVPAPGYGSSPAPGNPLTPITTPVNVTGTTTFTVSRPATAQLDITSVTVTGGPVLTVAPGSFSIPDGGLAQTVTVSCNSAAPGTFNGTVTVVHNAAGSPATYPVQCDVTAAPAPGYGSSPAPGNPLTPITTPVNVTGTTTFTVSETGNAQLDITSVTVTGGPVLTVAPGSFSIPDGGLAQTVTVSCNSAAPGTFNGTVTVVHNAAGSPATYPVQCDVTAAPAPGYGSNPAPGNPLTPITTPVNVTGTTTFTVSETGTAQLDITSVTVTGGPVLTVAPGSFSIPDGGLAQTVTVSCNSAAPGTFNGTVTVVHNAAGSPATYPVQCDVTAAPAPGYGSSPAPGNPLTPITTPVNVTGTTTFTVSETGTAQLDITSVTVTGGPVLTVAPGSFSIPDGGLAQTVTVSCNSAAVGVFNGTVTVAHNAAGSPAQYPVSCSVGPLGQRGDMDQDQDPDLIFRSSTTGQIQIWMMAAQDITLQTTTTPSTLADLNWKLQATADLNSDGHTDLIWRHALSGKNVVWFMNQTTRTSGVFLNPDTLADPKWQIAATGQFNGDGKWDLLWRNSYSGRNVVWTMDGVNRLAGQFTTPDTQPVDWQVAGTGDFDGDQESDILWQRVTDGFMRVWLMDGLTRVGEVDLTPQLPLQKQPDWRIFAVEDYDGNGRPDLVWRNQNSGRVVMWFMDATGINRQSGSFTSPVSLQPLDWRIDGPR